MSKLLFASSDSTESHRISRRVAAGDQSGQAFVFRNAGDTGPTLDEQLRDIRGAVATEVRVKSLKGFGRNRTSRLRARAR